MVVIDLFSRFVLVFFFSSRRRHTRYWRDWSSDVCSSDLNPLLETLIEVDTKGLRRWPLSGETLPATRRQLRRLRASPFDLAIDFQGLLKSALVARLSGARRRAGFSREHLREPASRLLLTETVRVPQRLNVIRKNLALAAGALGVRLPSGGESLEFPVHVSPAHEREADEVVQKVG